MEGVLPFVYMIKDIKLELAIVILESSVNKRPMSLVDISSAAWMRPPLSHSLISALTTRQVEPCKEGVHQLSAP